MSTQNALQAELLSRLIDEVEDYAVLLLNTQGIIQNWNRGAQRIKGYTADEIIGSSFNKFYTEEDKQAGKPEMLIAIAYKQGRARDEGWRVRKDGTVFWGSVVITAIHDDNGKVTGFGKVTRDLSERRQAELEEQNARQLEYKNKELEQFNYIASHDLQEPLRTINGMLGMLSKEGLNNLNEKEKKMMQYAVEASNRMNDLIMGLLEYCRLGRNTALVPVDCNQLVEAALADLDFSIKASQAVILVNKLPVIKGYEMELRMLFQNLLGNALKFHQKERPPEIKINALKEQGYWLFSVADNGIGIADEHKERIFMIFQRLHGKNDYPGTGIGLAHCRKIVDMHGGKLWVESKPGAGSVFYFTIKT